jgi:hypothetical protein
MGKRDVPEAALRMFIKQPCIYVGVPEEIELDLRFHEVGGSTEFFHIRNFLHGYSPSLSKNAA